MAIPVVSSRILIVDDEPTNTLALSAVLKSRGFYPIIAHNAQEGLEKLERDGEIKLVLMDMMMPEMDGYEATSLIKKDERICHLPVIAVTAQAMLHDKDRCIAAGVDDYISKPVDIDELMRIIHKHIAS